MKPHRPDPWSLTFEDVDTLSKPELIYKIVVDINAGEDIQMIARWRNVPLSSVAYICTRKHLLVDSPEGRQQERQIRSTEDEEKNLLAVAVDALKKEIKHGR